MRKLIAAINVTLDGFCDHTAIIPAGEMHEHYTALLHGADAILYGRTTYELMKHWQTVANHPTGDKAEDDFAVAMDKLPKLVFSRTLQDPGWDSARLANGSLEDEVRALKRQRGNDVLVGSPSLILQLTERMLIDEYQLCVHPVVAGSGLPLFKGLREKVMLELVRTKTFDFGAIVLCYVPAK